MEVPQRFQEVCERIKHHLGAERFYVLDVDGEVGEGSAGRVAFGMRNAVTSVLQARLDAARMVQEATNELIAVDILTDPFEEVEYLFDRYLRSYIATHGGVVTTERIEEDAGEIWINMDGGCSGCPASLATLKHGIERTLKKHLPWVRRVDAINEPVEPDFKIRIDLLKARIAEGR